MRYQVIVAGKQVVGFETSSRRRAHQFVRDNFTRAYRARDYRIQEPTPGATIRWRINAR